VPEEELQLIKEHSIANLAEIKRRHDENDPLEVRNIPGTFITLRVLGFIDRKPVLDGRDIEAWDAHMDKHYECHWCCDAKRVYLHGEQNEPGDRRRRRGSPCHNCCPVLTTANYWTECERLPGIDDTAVDVRSLMRDAVSAYLSRGIQPYITKDQSVLLLGPIGSLVSLDKQGLTVTFQEYADSPDENGGRLRLVNDAPVYLSRKTFPVAVLPDFEAAFADAASVRDVMLKLPPVSRSSHFRLAASAAFAAPPSATISGFRYSST
jgi:hypothetical protein